MNWVHPTSLLLGTWLAVFGQAWFQGFRHVAFAQPDLVPGLVVYSALYARLPTTAAVAILGGLGCDSLSAGPFGLGVVPLLVLGVFLQRKRDVILRDSPWAQVLLGAVASLGVWLVSYVLLGILSPLVLGAPSPVPHLPEIRAGLTALPDSGFGRLWQGTVVTVGGAVATPLLFRCYRWINAAFNYQPAPVPGHRNDREIDRGRS